MSVGRSGAMSNTHITRVTQQPASVMSMGRKVSPVPLTAPGKTPPGTYRI